MPQMRNLVSRRLRGDIMTIEDAVRAEAEADRLASRAAMKADSARGRLAASRGAGLSETEMAVLAA